MKTCGQASFRLPFPCPQSLNFWSLAIQCYQGDSGEREESHVFLQQLEQVVLLWKTNAGDKQKKASGGSGPVKAHTDSVPFGDTGSQRWQTQRVRRALGGDTRGPQSCREGAGPHRLLGSLWSLLANERFYCFLLLSTTDITTVSRGITTTFQRIIQFAH